MSKSKINCPYCGEILEHPPKTKKKCPDCKNPVYFRINPYTNKEYYLTENDADKINKLIDRYRIEEKFFNKINEYGLTEKYFKKRRNEYDKKAKGNYSAFAFVNSIFNELSLIEAKKGNWQDLSIMYWSMAYFLFDYNQNFSSYLYESKKMELYDKKKSEENTEIKYNVQILTDGKGFACEKCFKQEGKIFNIDEALKKMPIPVKDCENGFCRCSYVYNVDKN